ncbi:MerR family transcriptional regulator [Telmatospirillum sp.]|uniref:MerR family transcriptional regulator n=1 Tax=Telmatospirillum sp. TaxID=2079197 RepID=UPI00283BE664|nr:MerR family transcriptional regulator [Telmatospirillum sp.]MDR3440843.1 MerR family transcriptional regulator [Telmatospirillum sp.]
MIETEDSETPGLRRPVKSEAAFRTISEVSEDLEVPQHVLRFWESKFSQIKPLKRGGGRRYYRPEDLQLLKRIRDLLYKDGYTIRGVQKLLRETSRGHSVADGDMPKTATDVTPLAAAPEMPEPPPDEPAAEPDPDAPVDEPLAVSDDEPKSLRGELQILLAELEDLRAFLVRSRS